VQAARSLSSSAGHNPGGRVGAADHPGFGLDGRFVLTSDEVLDLEQLPESAAVIGGGPFGCEFASMLADMGTRVTVLEALPSILPGVDSDVTNVVVKSFTRRGIDIRTGVMVERAHSVRGRQVDPGEVAPPPRARAKSRASRSRRSWCRWAAGPTVTGCLPPGRASKSMSVVS